MWDPAAVSRTARRLHLPSEAARRYEREVDPAISVAALDRCAGLLAEIAGGEVRTKLTDWRGDPPVGRLVADCRRDPDRRRPAGPHGRGGLSGRARRSRRLTQIGAAVRPMTGDSLTVTPPSWRPDLLQPADLVEEVLRLEGLDVIPSVLPSAPAGRGLSAGQTSPPRRSASRWRCRATSRSCRRRSCPPAFSTPGGCPPTTRGVAPPRCSTRWRPIGRIWPPRCCRGCWRRWRATSPAASSTSRCSPSRRWCSRPRRPRASS